MGVLSFLTKNTCCTWTMVRALFYFIFLNNVAYNVRKPKNGRRRGEEMTVLWDVDGK